MDRDSVQQIVDGIFLWQGQILLFLERTTRGGSNYYWLPPSGKIENGEETLTALHRELQEELGLTASILQERQINFFCYGTRRGNWFGQIQDITHFLAEVSEPPPIKLLVGQLDFGWFSRPPPGGVITETLETLFLSLHLDGYLG